MFRFLLLSKLFPFHGKEETNCFQKKSTKKKNVFGFYSEDFPLGIFHCMPPPPIRRPFNVLEWVNWLSRERGGVSCKLPNKRYFFIAIFGRPKIQKKSFSKKEKTIFLVLSPKVTKFGSDKIPLIRELDLTVFVNFMPSLEFKTVCQSKNIFLTPVRRDALIIFFCHFHWNNVY